MNKTQEKRRQRLLPNGIPRYVRCYDYGNLTPDRYTAVYTGRAAVTRFGRVKWFPFVAMSGAPFHPQGFGQHDENQNNPLDCPGGKWPPALGRRCHLGTRILFKSLPKDCQKLVLRDYKEIWNL